MRIDSLLDLYSIIVEEVYKLPLSDSNARVGADIVMKSKWGNTKYAEPLSDLQGPFEQSLFIAYLKKKYFLSRECFDLLNFVDASTTELLPFTDLLLSISNWQGEDAVENVANVYDGATFISDLICDTFDKSSYYIIWGNGIGRFSFFSDFRFDSYQKAVHWLVCVMSVCYRVYKLGGNMNLFTNRATILKGVNIDKASIISKFVVHYSEKKGTNLFIPDDRVSTLIKYTRVKELEPILLSAKSRFTELFGNSDVVVLVELNGENYLIQRSGKCRIKDLPSNVRVFVESFISDIVKACNSPVKQIVLECYTGEDCHVYESPTVLNEEGAVDIFLGNAMDWDLSLLKEYL